MRFRRYQTLSALVVGAWLVCWLVAFPNTYGWHFDDVIEFTSIQLLTASSWLNPQFLQAYTWLITPVPILLHALHVGVPSLAQGQDWPVERSGFFRLIMLYTLLLQAAILYVFARFLFWLAPNARFALFALALVCLSPPLNFWAALVDNRLLGLLTALPGLWLLMAVFRSEDTDRRAGIAAMAAGLLIGFGYGIHYTSLYVTVPWSLMTWALFIVRKPALRTIGLLGAFVVGIGLYFGLCEAAFHVVVRGGTIDPLEWLLYQNGQHISRLTPFDRRILWLGMFATLMGWPMMVATVAGIVICAVRRLRPSWLDRDTAIILAGSAVLATLYLLQTSSMGFYRQTACLQLIFAALSALAIAALPSRSRVAIAAQFLAFAAVAFVPTSHSIENFAANTALGRTFHRAYALTRSHGTVYFFEWAGPAVPHSWWRAVLGPAPNDIVVTMMPRPVRAPDPYMLGVLHDTPTLAAFNAQLCTTEGYLEGEEINQFRHWDREPESCQARAYAGSAVVAEMNSPPLYVRSISSDSMWSAGSGPANMLDDGDGTPRPVGWGSDGKPGAHHVQIVFACGERLDALTVVAPDYIGNGDRIDRLAISGSATTSTPHALWSGSDLQDAAVFTATWPPQTVRRLDIVLSHASRPLDWRERPPGFRAGAVGIARLLVPHRRLTLLPPTATNKACPRQ